MLGSAGSPDLSWAYSYIFGQLPVQSGLRQPQLGWFISVPLGFSCPSRVSWACSYDCGVCFLERAQGLFRIRLIIWITNLYAFYSPSHVSRSAQIQGLNKDTLPLDRKKTTSHIAKGCGDREGSDVIIFANCNGEVGEGRIQKISGPAKVLRGH